MGKINHLYSLDKFKYMFHRDPLIHENPLSLEDFVPVTIAFDLNKYVSAGSPGVTLKTNLLNDSDEKGIAQVIFPFPTTPSIVPGTQIEIKRKNLYALPEKNLIANHKIKTIPIFQKDKLKDIKKYVSINGAITFIIPDLVKSANFWLDISDLCSKYKYTMSFYHFTRLHEQNYHPFTRLRDQEEEFIPFVSFIDLPYCIPIFDHRKIDGMGIRCGLIYKKTYKENGKIRHEIEDIKTLYFVVSNYQTNFLHVDGAQIGMPSNINTSIIKELATFIRDEINFKDPNNQSPLLNNKIIGDGKVEWENREVLIKALKEEDKKQHFGGHVSANISTSSASFTSWTNMQ